MSKTIQTIPENLIDFINDLEMEEEAMYEEIDDPDHILRMELYGELRNAVLFRVPMIKRLENACPNCYTILKDYETKAAAFYCSKCGQHVIKKEKE